MWQKGRFDIEMKVKNFTFFETTIEGVYVIEPDIFKDQRGYFSETYQAEAFHAAGLAYQFVVPVSNHA